MRSLAPDSGSSFREREIGERRQPGGGSGSPLSSSFSGSSASSSSPGRPAPGSARLAPPQEGEKRRGEQRRGGGRRGSGGRRRRWRRRPRRNQRGASESGAQAAAPRPGRARAPRTARNPAIRTFPAPGGLQQEGGRAGACVRRQERSGERPARPGAGRGRRRQKEHPPLRSAAGDAGRSWGFATRRIKSSPAGPLLLGKGLPVTTGWC